MRADDAGGTVDEDADVERELILKSRGATPSQTNAKELKAISARHSPSKILFDWRRFLIRFDNPGSGSSSVGSAVQLLLL